MKRAILILGVVCGLSLSSPGLAEASKPAAAEAGPTADSARLEREKRAAEIVHQMLPPEVASGMASKRVTGNFGGEMSRLAMENAYEQLWTRPGLSLRDRSMVTIAMLIALGNESELKVHLESGLRNGLTPQELQEIIYQATAYVGFPRASGALAIASKVVAQQGGAR
jgi:4-carboxymuconolactone decarboxylase